MLDHHLIGEINLILRDIQVGHGNCWATMV